MPKPTSIGWIPASQLERWIDSYNTSPVSKSSQPSDELREIARSCGGIVCSSLNRSITSAELLNREQIIVKCDLFTEAELPYTALGRIKLPAKVWALIFRLYWLAGLPTKSESKTQAHARAKDAAVKLTDLAEIHGNILYVGHGIFNRLIAKELVIDGWQGPLNPSSAYWGYTVYHSKDHTNA